jgi:membrane protein
MANGLNAILGGFQNSKHVLVKRGFFTQYFVAIGISLVSLIDSNGSDYCNFWDFYSKLNANEVLNDKIPLMVFWKIRFSYLMILITTSILFKFGTKHDRSRSFISIGSIFTTILTIIISYFFGIWVIKFSRYNQLYGSIGTLLIVMFYIWINSCWFYCLVLS